MATSILPDEEAAGGVVYRDAAGLPTNPPNVHNAYPPLPAFLSTCQLTALPSDCEARIEPRQINAIVSELLSFAECMNPGGTWNCSTLRNLCTAFTAWAAVNVSGVIISDTPPGTPRHGLLWWESDTGYLYIWYDDGSSAQWVQIIGDTTLVVATDEVTIVGTGETINPLAVGEIDCGTY